MAAPCRRSVSGHLCGAHLSSPHHAHSAVHTVGRLDARSDSGHCRCRCAQVAMHSKDDHNFLIFLIMSSCLFWARKVSPAGWSLPGVFVVVRSHLWPTSVVVRSFCGFQLRNSAHHFEAHFAKFNANSSGRLLFDRHLQSAFVHDGGLSDNRSSTPS